MPLSRKTLEIDAAAETDRISKRLRHLLSRVLNRRGLVVGLSGGVDSSVTAALAARALGKDRVFGILMPERESDPESRALGQEVADALGIACIEEDITPILEAAGFYRRYGSAVSDLIPGFGPGWASKLVIDNKSGAGNYARFSVVAQDPAGTQFQVPLPLKQYLEIVSATNFKQRIRKMMEYYHADRLNFAVAGTPNRLEYDQGFFVKNGDGSADIKPIAHLYKCQVYQLAAYLGLPESVRLRPPTTDTYSMQQGQDEFYFAVPHEQMDLCLYGKNHGMPPESVAGGTGLSVDDVQRIWRDIDRKRAATLHLHLPPLLMEPIPEIVSTDPSKTAEA